MFESFNDVNLNHFTHVTCNMSTLVKFHSCLQIFAYGQDDAWTTKLSSRTPGRMKQLHAIKQTLSLTFDRIIRNKLSCSAIHHDIDFVQLPILESDIKCY